jgi:probable HAF family extracellular repeat protein
MSIQAHPPLFQNKHHRITRLLCQTMALVLTMLFFVQLAQAELINIGVLNNGSGSYLNGVSGDGSVVGGFAMDGANGNARNAISWTQAGGFSPLGFLNNGTFAGVDAVSDNGAVFVGGATNGPAATFATATYWTQAGGAVSLGYLGTGTTSYAYDVSADGSVIVGYSATNGTQSAGSQAFRWTQAGGMVGLGQLNGGTSTKAYGVNSDGSVIVGYGQDAANGNAVTAIRWTQAGGIVGLGMLNGGTSSNFTAVNSDGSVAVGDARDGTNGNAVTAIRWTQAGGMVGLGMLAGGNISQARDVSGDGSIVVGGARDGALAYHGFRWTQAGGMQTVDDWLRSTGVVMPTDLTTGANAISSDGTTIVGTALINGVTEGYIARAGNAAPGGGLITLSDLSESLSSSATALSSSLPDVNLIINGVHSRPLSRRIEPGQNTYWLAGDLGQDNHGSRDGDLGLAEIGFGRNMGPIQLNASFGNTWMNQDLVHSGDYDADGYYLFIEGLKPLTKEIWGVLSAYYHHGNADIDRGYINAGTLDSSSGDTDTNTWAIRARLEWLDAYKTAKTAISPFVEISYAEMKMDAFTETGGGFPAKFDSRKEQATEFHVGINSTTAVTENTNIWATLEGVHRFQEDGAAITGQVLGLSNFSLDSRQYDQTWGRVGLGLDSAIGPGTASLMVNGTSEGEAPSLWLAASYQVNF